MEDRELRDRRGRPHPRASRALLAAALFAVLPIPASAEAVDRNEHHREAVLRFSEQDEDGDGLLQELEAMDLGPERFAAADRDGDGRLSLVEYVDARFEELPAETGAPAVEAPPESDEPAPAEAP